VTAPVTSACALIARQLANCGTASTLPIVSVKAAGSIGANRPLRCRFAVMIWETPVAVSSSPSPPATNFAIAIGSGWKLPPVMSRRTTAAACRDTSVKPPAAAPSASALRRVRRR
jgi:hypothetical protein